MLSRYVPRLFLGMLTLVVAAPASSEDVKPTELTVTPQAAPDQALRYRLLPLESQRTPGDAVPIYLRLGGETRSTNLNELATQASKLMNTPIAEFSVEEAHKLLDPWESRLKQMEFGARRQTAEWNYTIPEQREDVIMILLPDVQELRNWTRLLALKARTEVAAKTYDQAIHTIETGLSMARHIAEGPFLINALVGIAVANQFVAQLEDLVAQPDAPNLYWALTALPRPLVSVRKAMETEQTMLENMLPEITDLDDPRTEAEWASRLARLHGRWNRIARMIEPVQTIQPADAPSTPSASPNAAMMVPDDLAKFVAEVLPDAKAFLKTRGVSIDGMSDAEIIVRSIAAQHREIRDLTFRPTYLPYVEAAPLYQASETLRSRRKGLVPDFLRAFEPAVVAAHKTETRLDRRVAALRIVEAIRMHLAASQGKLPKSLDEIEIVPIPFDPMTGKAFQYAVEGETATLSSSGEPAFAYKIRVAK